MAFHHIVALYLFGGLYLMNLWEGGSVFALLHDIADVGVWLVKFWGETNYGNVAGACFVTLMGVWLWTRCLVLPYMIYISAVGEVPIGNIIRPVFVYLLLCMFLLHCYWFTIFCKILRKFIVEGEAEDLQS